MKKYGVENPYQSEIIKDKCKKIKLERYGDEHYRNNEKIIQTTIERFGCESHTQNEEFKQKMKDQNQLNQGVDFCFQREDVKGHIKQTCLIRYGVEYPSQNVDINEKSCRKRLLIKQFKQFNIYYQGSYELDFLNKYYGKFLDIKRGPSIKYIVNDKNKVYHSDFYIPSLNLIVEIKSSWVLSLDIDINKKKESTINSGFNYIMILNKNYKEFDEVSSRLALFNNRKTLALGQL